MVGLALSAGKVCWTAGFQWVELGLSWRLIKGLSDRGGEEPSCRVLYRVGWSAAGVRAEYVHRGTTGALVSYYCCWE